MTTLQQAIDHIADYDHDEWECGVWLYGSADAWAVEIARHSNQSITLGGGVTYPDS
jgi:hypothetical protein